MPDKRVTELTAIDAVVDTDLVMVVDDPAGTAASKKATVTQLLVNAARTDVSNTFTGDQTVDGDLFVTGEVNPARIAQQKVKIDLLSEVAPGDPVGSRTVMSRSLVSGLSLRHDEALGQGRVTVGNYDTQLYQPLLFETESFQVHTGTSPGARVERLRVHPTGGVTVGNVHTVDPGAGVVQAGGLGSTPLNASQLLSGTVPQARLPPPVEPIFFTQNPTIERTAPGLFFRDTSQPVDGTLWEMFTYNGTAYFQPLTDAGNTVNAGFQIARNGTVEVMSLGSTPLNASQLLSGVVPNACLPTWQNVPFLASNFQGDNGMVVTVTAGMVGINRYVLSGKTLTWILALNAFSLSGGSGNVILVLPGGFTSMVGAQVGMTTFHNSLGGMVWRAGALNSAATGNFLQAVAYPNFAWTPGDSVNYLMFTVVMEIQ